MWLSPWSGQAGAALALSSPAGGSRLGPAWHVSVTSSLRSPSSVPSVLDRDSQPRCHVLLQGRVGALAFPSSPLSSRAKQRGLHLQQPGVAVTLGYGRPRTQDRDGKGGRGEGWHLVHGMTWGHGLGQREEGPECARHRAPTQGAAPVLPVPHPSQPSFGLSRGGGLGQGNSAKKMPRDTQDRSKKP